MSIALHRRVTESGGRKRTGKETESERTIERPGFRNELVAKIPHLRAFARMLAMNVDRADDLVRETLAKAWAGQRGLALDTDLKVWLFTILRKEFHSRLPRRGREVPDTRAWEGGAVPTGVFAVPPARKGPPDQRAFIEALALLPQQLREALVLVGASGFSCEEAAEICRCPAETVRSRVNRARGRLREMLAPHAVRRPRGEGLAST